MATNKPADASETGMPAESDIANASTEAGVADESAACDRAIREDDGTPTTTQA